MARLGSSPKLLKPTSRFSGQYSCVSGTNPASVVSCVELFEDVDVDKGTGTAVFPLELVQA